MILCRNEAEMSNMQRRLDLPALYRFSRGAQVAADHHAGAAGEDAGAAGDWAETGERERLGDER